MDYALLLFLYMNVKELLKKEGEYIKNDIKSLLDYSTIKFDSSCRRYVSGGIPLPGFGEYVWSVLPIEGKQLQSKLIDIYSKYVSKIKMFLRNLPIHSHYEFQSEIDFIEETIFQENFPDESTPESVFLKIENSFNVINSFLNDIYSYSTNTVLLIADANSMIYNPDFERWYFDNFSEFTIVLTPTLISELDILKVDPKKPQEVKDKARKIHNKINDYDSRKGNDILKGVVLVRNKISLISEPIEPNFKYTLSFLNPDNKDDRYIVSTLEIMFKHNSSEVYLVTSDFNLKQKCRIASVPILSPPIPLAFSEK